MTLEQLPLIMLRALFLTLVIECCAAWILGARRKQDQATVVLVNLLTNPVVVATGAAVQFYEGHEFLLPITLVMEIMTVIIEGSVYKKEIAGCKSPYMLSLTCNLISFISGEILNRFVF